MTEPAAPATSTTPHGEGRPRSLAPLGDLAALAQGAVLLGIVGASVGLLLWTRFALDAEALAAFVDANTLPHAARTVELLALATSGVAALAAGALWAFREPDRGRALLRFARRTAPLAVVGVMPLLWSWHLWTKTPIVFGVLLALSSAALLLLLRLRSEAAPLPLEAALAKSAPLAQVRRALAPPATTTSEERSARAAFAVVVAAAVGWAVWFGVITIRAHWNLRTKSFDLGLEDNLLWNLVHGSEVFFKSSPFGGPEASHFGHHATWFAYVIAPFYALAQRAETLLVVQAVLVGAAAVPLFLFGRRHIGPWPAALIAVCYLLYPPVHGAMLYDFHYVTLAPVFVWSVWWLLDARRDRWAVLAILLTLSVREDVAVGLTIVGGWFVLFGGRPLAGFLVVATALPYFVIMKFGVMPLYKGDKQSFLYMFKGLLPEGERGYGGVLKTVIGNPAFTLRGLLIPDKVDFLLRIFAPLAFLPLRRPFTLMLLIPGFLFTLLSTGYGPLIKTSFQYSTHWTVYLFPAIVLQLAVLARAAAAGEERAASTFRSWLVVLCFALVTASHQHGAVLQHNTSRAGFRRFEFQTRPSDLERREHLAALLVHLPKDAKVVASEMLAPHVSNRPDTYTMRFGSHDAEYVLMEPRALDERERRTLERALAASPFGLVAQAGPFVLLRRGGDPATLAPLGLVDEAPRAAP